MAKLRKKLLVGLLQLFLMISCLGAFGFTSLASQRGGRVLFISSYSYAWDVVRLQMEGIRDGLGDDVMLDYEFMDTKQVYDEESVRLFYESLKYKLEHMATYDAVILGDDEALKFAMEYQEELFDGIPLVFEGVNDETFATEAAADPYITGVLEQASMEKNIQLGLELIPNANKIVAIVDNSLAGQAEREHYYKCAEQFPQLQFYEINTANLTTTSLRQEIRAVDKNTILLYISMTEDKSGRQYTDKEAVAVLSEVSGVPVFRMIEAGIGEGILGGNVVPMYESGYIAAGVVTDILDGADIREMQGVLDSPSEYRVDAVVMEKYGISEAKLPVNATVINEKQSFVERNREVLAPMGVLLIALLIIVVILIIDNYRNKKLLSELKNAKRTIETASQHDFLTGISNRSKFMGDLTQMFEEGIPCTIFMLDIDDFKHINDTMGHTAGDEALQQVADRLKKMSSQILTPYRYAGDEFILILQSSQQMLVEKTAYDCRQIFGKPFTLDKRPVKICGSIGIATYPKDTENLEELIIFADEAMYEVKKNGKNDFAFYKKKTEGEA